MNNKAKLLIALTLTAGAATSCKDKDYFDQGVYEEIVSGAFPVTDVDRAHTWETIKPVTVRTTLRTADKSIYTIRIYAGNPIGGDRPTLLASGRAQGQGRFETAINRMTTENTAYIALTAEDGHKILYSR